MRDPKAEARRWLAAAREELAWARHAAAGGFHAPACFHAQQGAEKAVKAVHFLRGARVVIGHNVRALIAESGTASFGSRRLGRCRARARSFLHSDPLPERPRFRHTG
jgi:HEPN domain-containing protein